jgi:hypothetical protein
MAPPPSEDEFRGRMKVEVEHIYERLGDIEAQLAELRSLLVARIDAHERYHQANEQKWGLIELCHRYPFRLLGVGVSLVVALVGGVRDPLLRWLVGLLK